MGQIERPHETERVDPQVARCFVAINLPTDVRESVASRQAQLRSHFAATLCAHPASHHRAIRWVRPELIHLTLLFLGDIRHSQFGDAKAALQNACAGINQLELHLDDFGCFPNAQRPRVLWGGLNGDITALRVLQAQVAAELKPFVAKPEDKEFHPHLTLARIKSEDKALCRRIGQMTTTTTSTTAETADRKTSWQVDSVELMRSVLAPAGPAYSILHSVRLDGN